MENIIKVKDLPYERFDMDKAKSAMQEFLAAEKSALSAEEVLNARNNFIKVYIEYQSKASLAFCRYTLNTRDEFYLAEQEFYDNVSPIMTSYYNSFADAMLNSRYRKELEKLLPETTFLNYEAAKKTHSDDIIEDEQEENALVTQYSQLMSQLTADWQGESKPLSYIRGFLEDKERNVRKAAALAIDAMLSKVSHELDDIFDRMVKVRDRMAKKLGYHDFIELGYYRMARIDYDRRMVAAFRKNVLKDIVPIVAALKQNIANAMGYDKIYFYDNDIIEGDGNPKPYPDSDGILKAARKMYDEMSHETGSFMKKMLAAEAFDVTAREGKWGGGYCTEFAEFKQPFILANFNGSSGDVDVVTHEFGHALAMNYVYDYGDLEAQIGSSETAETHSMSMEFFSWKYMDKFFENPERYRYKHLADSLSFIPYGTLIDEFQHEVYAKPDMTPQQRNDCYLALEKKYRPYLSYEGLPYLSQGTRWQFQMHVYESPFYYIDYCLAQVVALEFLAEAEKDYNDALSRYFEHSKRGGLYPFNKLVKLAGLASPFDEGALENVAKVSVDILNSKSNG